jgi:tetratricopeptide (TPR) repeat protein
MNLYKIVLPISKRRSYADQSMNILNSMGNLYLAEARYDIALQRHFESLELRKGIGDEFAISVAAHNIGFVYYKIGNPDKAISYYSEALKLKKVIGNKHDIEHLLLNIGWCYIDKKDYNRAHEFFDTAFASCSDRPSDNFLMDAFLGMGYIAKGRGALNKAEEYFIKSYSTAKRNNDFRHVLDNIGQLSEIYIVRNKIQLAEKYLTEAEALIVNDDRYRLELASIYRQFSNLYSKSNDLERKVHFQEKYIALKDSIFNHQVTTNLMKAESEFVERESKTRIDTQNKILKLNNEIIFRQQIANASFGLVAVFGIAMAVILARRNKAKQVVNKLLDQKVAERTRELRSSQELMLRTLEEKSILAHKTTSELHSLIATTKGLCFLGSQEMDISSCQEYWRRLDATADGMRSTISKLTESRKDIHAVLVRS